MVLKLIRGGLWSWDIDTFAELANLLLVELILMKETDDFNVGVQETTVDETPYQDKFVLVGDNFKPKFRSQGDIQFLPSESLNVEGPHIIEHRLKIMS